MIIRNFGNFRKDRKYEIQDRVTIVTGAAQGKGTIGMPPQRIPFSELYYIVELHLKHKFCASYNYYDNSIMA